MTSSFRKVIMAGVDGLSASKKKLASASQATEAKVDNYVFPP